MVEFTIPKQSKVIVSIKRGRPSDIDETLAQNVAEILGDPIAWLPRLGTITPLEIDFTYGVVDAPGTEFIEWFLLNCDVDNIPAIESIRARSLWWRAQQWRSIGTDAGPVQTLTRDDIDLLNPESYSFTEVADFTQRQALCVISHTDASSARVRILGVVTYQETIIQRRFGNDNWTNVPDDVIGEDYDDVGSSDGSG